MQQYNLTLCVEHRTGSGRVARCTDHKRLVVQGIDTAPLAKFQANRPGQSIGVKYTKVGATP